MPAPDTYVLNLPGGAVPLTAAEWDQVRSNATGYAKLLGV
jgi:hypothetical protein